MNPGKEYGVLHVDTGGTFLHSMGTAEYLVDVKIYAHQLYCTIVLKTTTCMLTTAIVYLSIKTGTHFYYN
jgi:hypothetical protein